MTHQLNIKSEDAYRLASQLAELTGESLTTAVTTALRERLERERQQRHADQLAAELVEIGRRCAAHLTPPFSSADHADFYGEDGLPQ
jgi:antitoxin VapB